jgi:hypothetical protein
MNSAFQKQVRAVKEKHLNELCKEMEDEGKKERTKEMFSKVRTITRKRTLRMGSIKMKDEQII